MLLNSHVAHEPVPEQDYSPGRLPERPEGLPPQRHLFPGQADRKAADSFLSVLLSDARARTVAGPVGATIGFDEALGRLRGWDFQSPRRLQDVLVWVVAQMADGVVHVDHPRYFGLFNPTPTFPAQCAERIMAAFNPQLATHVTSPFPVAMEAHLIRHVADRAGFGPAASGHFTNGGSEANFTALICALTQADPAFGEQGAGVFQRRPAVYVSEAAHLAWLKIAHQAGIGRSAVRLVGTDGTGRLDAARLAARLAADQEAGFMPVMIVSTAGTTGAGMVDPVEACTGLARRHGAWHHVDAAWGGAALFSERLRPLLDGLSSADSVTIDAHKWLATTMGCGIFLTADAAIQNQAFHVAMPCMPSAASELDPYVNSCQWSRRFLGLRLFVALACSGWDGYASYLERSVELAATLAAMLCARGWSVINRSGLAVLCVRPPAGSVPVAAICAAVVGSGQAWVSPVAFEGETVVRICMTSGETTGADLTQLVAALASAADG